MKANLGVEDWGSSESLRSSWIKDVEGDKSIEEPRRAAKQSILLPVKKDVLDPVLFDERYLCSAGENNSRTEDGGREKEEEDGDESANSPTKDELAYYDPSQSFDAGFGASLHQPDWSTYTFDDNDDEAVDRSCYSPCTRTFTPTYTFTFTISKDLQQAYTYTLCDYGHDFPSSASSASSSASSPRSSSRSSSPDLVPSSQVEKVLPSTVREAQWRQACSLLQTHRKGEKAKRRLKQEERRKEAKKVVRGRIEEFGSRWMRRERWRVLEESGLRRELE